MSNYINIIKANPETLAGLRYSFSSPHYPEDPIILKSLKISEIPNVLEFLHHLGNINNEHLEAVDIFILRGIILQKGLPAYALFYDGDETNKELIVNVDGKIQHGTVAVDSPIILISKNVAKDELLFYTTIIHEVCHLIDGMPSGERMAKKLEYDFLLNIGFEPEKAREFLSKKYSYNFHE